MNYKQKYTKYKNKYLGLKGGQDNQSSCIKQCMHVHMQEGLNYPWLNDIKGGLHKVQYMEPPNSGEWKEYSEKTWRGHCKLVSHNADNLIYDHIKAFVNPDTRFAKLKYIFNNGEEIELDYKHAIEYYQKESEYFRKNNICENYQQ